MIIRNIKKLAIPVIIILIVSLLISWFWLDRHLNEPSRVVESMLNSRLDFEKNPSLAKKFFESVYLSKVKVAQGAIQTSAHILKVSSIGGQDVVVLSFSKSQGSTASSDQIIKFNLKKHGVYPLFYWTKIENVQLIDARYLADFANILPETKTTEKNLGEQFALAGRFDISLENFKRLSVASGDGQVVKYSFDIDYKTKPIDFHALSIFVSLLGENGMTCLKSQKVEISDLTKSMQSVRLTVFGDFCNPKSIQVDGAGIDSINVSIK